MHEVFIDTQAGFIGSKHKMLMSSEFQRKLLKGGADLNSVRLVGVFGEVGAAGVAGRNVLDTVRATHGVEGIVRTRAVQKAGRSVEDERVKQRPAAGTQH